MPPNPAVTRYAPLAREAGQRFGVDPALLLADINQESGGREVTSSAGARGITQFIPGTAAKYGVKYGTSPEDVRSQVMGQARYLAGLGAGKNAKAALEGYLTGTAGSSAGEGYANSVLAQVAAYRGAVGGAGGAQQPGAPGGGFKVVGGAEGPQTAAQAILALMGSQRAQPAAQSPLARPEDAAGPPMPEGFRLPTPAAQPEAKPDVSAILAALGGQSGEPTARLEATGGAPGSSGYVDPVPGFTVGRTDMGVDLSAKPGAAIKALGNGKVLGIQPDWYRGQPYVYYQLTDGPQKGKVVYVAEQIKPTVKPGQEVRAGQQIGVYAPSGTGIETGFGRPGGRTQAQATTGYTEGQQTQAGQQFRKFLGELGVR